MKEEDHIALIKVFTCEEMKRNGYLSVSDEVVQTYVLYETVGCKRCGGHTVFRSGLEMLYDSCSCAALAGGLDGRWRTVPDGALVVWEESDA